MRIVVFADSLSLPRIEDGDVVNWEDTWAYLLKKKLSEDKPNIEVINCGARARVSDSLIKHDYQEHIQFKKPDTVIVQVGIVDCAPRIISLKEKDILNSKFIPRMFRESLIRYRKKNKQKIIARAPLKRVYTSPIDFKRNLQQFISKIKSEQRNIDLIFIPIVANIPFMEESSPSYGSNIDLYNRIIKELADKEGLKFLNLSRDFWETPSFYCSDGYHLSSKGNRELVKELVLVI